MERLTLSILMLRTHTHRPHCRDCKIRLSAPTSRTWGIMKELTHHQSFDFTDLRALDALPHENDPKTSPNEQENTECDGNQPIERRQVI